MDSADHWLKTKADYDRDGFVVITDILLQDDCDRLLVEVAEIGRGKRGAVRDPVMVRGNDPCSWKGVEDITYSFLCAEMAELDDPNHDVANKIF